MSSLFITQADSLGNAFLQTLLLFLCPLLLSLLIGGLTGLGLYIRTLPGRGDSMRSGAKAAFVSYAFLGLLPVILLLVQAVAPRAAVAALYLLLVVAGTAHAALGVEKALGQVDRHVLEAAVASGLTNRQVILRVLLPQGKLPLAAAFLSLSLFVLAAGAIGGAVAAGGLMGLAKTASLAPCLMLETLLYVLLLTASLWTGKARK